jgi:DNA-directed RNA polymerase specialized sigma24 family protein
MDIATLEPHVKQVCAYLVRDQNWREDAEQDAWERIIAVSRTRPVPVPLARTIAKQKCYDLFRREQRKGERETPYFDTHDPVTNSGVECSLDVDTYVESTDGPTRSVLDILIHENHSTTRDIAKRVGCSQRTVVRVMQAFRDYLKEQI